MNRRRSLTIGILLILIGGWYLAVQLFEPLEDWLDNFAEWPFLIIGLGLLFLVTAIVSGVSGLAIPGTIISGIGGIFYYQNYYNDWESWAYAWTLIIGFVGIGVFIMHLLEGNFRKAVSEGGNTILNSAVLFLIFGSFFRAIFDQDPFLGDYWPLLLIFAGLWMLVRPFLRRRKPVEVEAEIEVIEEA
ncbi:MAG: hypothetical protein E3J88_01775 [Anaerolineales bacterium]|nr:MAG: hypothetical protein E3J88_01775 [Anaerolineales bacterium]